MLDVHPPHHAATTWRDFFIHIATIVVGLLIAIGLEQTVEWVHHRHQISETREALRHERESNAETFGQNTAFLRHNINALRNDMTVLLYLKAHPGTPAAQLPGVLFWPNLNASLSDIAWRSAQAGSITALLPPQEVYENAQLYEALSVLRDEGSRSWDATTRAGAYALRDPDVSRLTPAEVEEELRLTQDALLAKYRLGVAMANIGLIFRDFKPAPELKEMEQLSVAAPLSEEEKKKLETAREITRARMASTPVSR